MPAVITRLRIAGFKSFAEAVTIEILPGLTGIVGPNGCGKSNVVEALRWAMGETSARSLRGGEMDEVIFAGSAARPSRSIAEVTVTLDEAAGLAPPPLAAESELQVSRHIERGAGSTYRVNGREMRARDVQTMFADLASGARSSGMVSQGRVAFLVDARADERRSVLEEAAGITGLHARRHEAELRLRAAEGNLARVSDLRSGLASQHATLLGQAEQARLYTEAVAALEDAERGLLSVRLARARRGRETSARALAEARVSLAAAERAAAETAESEHAAETAIGRESGEFSLAIATLERARAGYDALASEQARAAEALARSSARLAEVTRDRTLAGEAVEQTEETWAALAREAARRREFLAGFDDAWTEAESARLQARQTALEEAEREAARLSLARELDGAEAGLRAAASRLATARSGIEAAERSLPAETAVEAAASLVAVGAQRLARARDEAASAEADRRMGDDARAEAVRQAAALEDASVRAASALADARSRRDRLATEHEAAARRQASILAERAPAASIEGAVQAAAAARTRIDDLQAALGVARQRRFDADAADDRARAEAADARAGLREAEGLLEAARRERERLKEQQRVLNAQAAEARALCVAPDMLVAQTARAEQAVAGLGEAREAVAASERARDEAMSLAARARETIAARQAEIAAAMIEHSALSAMGDDWSLLGLMRVPEELDAAVAAGLGEALAASLDPSAARHWRELGPLGCPALPDAAVPLDRLIEAPAALGRALSQIGLVEAEDAAAQSSLAPGQALVTRDGALLRWDGHAVRGGQPGPMAERLRARRRLEACERALAGAREALPELEATLAKAIDARDAAERGRDGARVAVEAAEHALTAERSASSTLAARDERARARADGLDAELARVTDALTRARDQETAAAGCGPDHERIEAMAARAGLAVAEKETAIAAETAARQALEDAEMMAAEMEAEARRLASRDEEAQAALASLGPLLARLASALEDAEVALTSIEADDRRRTDAFASHASVLAQVEDEAGRAGRRDEDARAELAASEIALAQARESHAALVARAREGRDRLAILAPDRDALLTECGQSQAALEVLRRRRDELGSDEGALEKARHEEAEAQRRSAALESEAEVARARLEVLAVEIAVAERRRDGGRLRLSELAERLQEARQAHATLEPAPGVAEARRQEAGSALAAAEEVHRTATGRMDEWQSALAARREARRTAEAALSTAREAVLRAETAVEQAVAASAEVEARGREAGGPLPAVNATAAAEADARREVARALRARDEIGPVNLLAARECDELGERLQELTREANELEEAVGRLRSAIGHLNREGRERLQASFTQIDAQFRSLFARMFDGGRAHLAMVGSDDPLQAGLEIYAQPPGKKLATLSLLSGGEQALTALSLIFAVFRCNPAPVCVLDEVDAPLDDANVERFCRLVSDMARETGTRFLVVTHHQLTMASMDRLYGVTMQERGVSRLLSVDLGRAAEMTGS